MGYFDGIEFHICGHDPRYRYEIDSSFPFYAINLIRSGSFVFGAGNAEPTPVRQLPCLLITTPGQRFRYGPGATGEWNHLYVTFSGPRVHNWIAQGLLPSLGEEGFLMQGLEDDTAFYARSLKLIQAVHTSPMLYEQAVHALEGLLLMVMETTGERRLPVASTIIHQQIASINAEPERPWDLDQMGSNAGYSKAHYRRLFFQYTGESPSRYIRHRRMHKAAHLLQATRLPVKAIAAACGYDDLFHFSKQFKLVYGKPPGVFRRQG